jgi:hypothetical protein
MIEAFNCLARSTAYTAAFLAVFDPSDGTRIFEIMHSPLIIKKVNNTVSADPSLSNTNR